MNTKKQQQEGKKNMITQLKKNKHWCIKHHPYPYHIYEFTHMMFTFFFIIILYWVYAVEELKASSRMYMDDTNSRNKRKNMEESIT